MTSTIKRPRGYRTAISSEVFEFVMKLLRDTLGTTGRYLDLMRRNAPLRIQGPGYRGLDAWLRPGCVVNHRPRQFYKWRQFKSNPMHFQCVQDIGGSSTSGSRHVHHIEYRQHIDSHYNHPFVPVPLNHGSIVPFRHTYNASRII
jgi:hypothetical protein